MTNPFRNQFPLPEPAMYVRLFTEADSFRIVMPVRLTGVYDRVAWRGVVCVHTVEVEFSTGDRRHVKLGDLCTEDGELLNYWELRRALLLQWMNQSYPPSPERGLTPYQRACASHRRAS